MSIVEPIGFSLSESAQRLGLSRRQLSRVIIERDVPVVPVGRIRLLTLWQIERLRAARPLLTHPNNGPKRKGVPP
jgi:hypothetical protein